jgi:hypothetical protein
VIVHRYIIEKISEGVKFERDPDNDIIIIITFTREGPVVPDNDPSLIGARTAIIWSNESVTMEELRRQGGPGLHRILEFLERITESCSPSRSAKILVEKPVIVEKWEQMKAGSLNGFVGLSVDGWEGWPRIAQFMSDGRNKEVRVGTKDEYPKSWERKRHEPALQRECMRESRRTGGEYLGHPSQLLPAERECGKKPHAQ